MQSGFADAFASVVGTDPLASGPVGGLVIAALDAAWGLSPGRCSLSSPTG